MSTPTYVYVASSWRNPIHPEVVETLRAEGIGCYDFKRDFGAQFGWHEVMPDTYVPGSETMAVGDYLGAIEHPRAIEGYASDFAAMQRADRRESVEAWAHGCCDEERRMRDRLTFGLRGVRARR